jgi:hypothetical protein
MVMIGAEAWGEQAGTITPVRSRCYLAIPGLLHPGLWRHLHPANVQRSEYLAASMSKHVRIARDAVSLE